MLRFILILITVFVTVVSCNDAIVTSDFQAIDDASWNKNNVLKFDFSVTDTLQKHHMFINIRNSQNYPYSNLFLIAELDYPNGDVVKDTLEFDMALPDGTWLGQGQGSIKESKLWYRENIIFPNSGVYTLEIEHAMRKNGSIPGVIDLEGITDVGLEIVKSKE